MTTGSQLTERRFVPQVQSTSARLSFSFPDSTLLLARSSEDALIGHAFLQLPLVDLPPDELQAAFDELDTQSSSIVASSRFRSNVQETSQTGDLQASTHSKPSTPCCSVGNEDSVHNTTSHDWSQREARPTDSSASHSQSYSSDCEPMQEPARPSTSTQRLRCPRLMNATYVIQPKCTAQMPVQSCCAASSACCSGNLHACKAPPQPAPDTWSRPVTINCSGQHLATPLHSFDDLYNCCGVSASDEQVEAEWEQLLAGAMRSPPPPQQPTVMDVFRQLQASFVSNVASNRIKTCNTSCPRTSLHSMCAPHQHHRTPTPRKDLRHCKVTSDAYVSRGRPQSCCNQIQSPSFATNSRQKPVATPSQTLKPPSPSAALPSTSEVFKRPHSVLRYHERASPSFGSPTPQKAVKADVFKVPPPVQRSNNPQSSDAAGSRERFRCSTPLPGSENDLNVSFLSSIAAPQDTRSTCRQIPTSALATQPPPAV